MARVLVVAMAPDEFVNIPEVMMVSETAVVAMAMVLAMEVAVAMTLFVRAQGRGRGRECVGSRFLGQLLDRMSADHSGRELLTVEQHDIN